jgi:hypothetical protein
LSPGEHILEVAERSSKAAITFEVRPGAVPVIHEPIQASNLKVAAVGSLGTAARLYGGAVDAAVMLDGQTAGQLPAAGLDLVNLQEGPHEVQLGEGSGQLTLAFNTSGVPTLAAVLKSDRNVGGLRIIANEDGATVYLNGEAYRRKTERGRLLVYLVPREYTVRIEKPGFEAVEQQVAEVRRGEEARLEFALRALPETASLTIRNAPAGAEVLIGGKSVGNIAAGSASGTYTLPAGPHTVAVRHQGFKPKEWKLQLKPGEAAEIDGALLSAVGILEIAVEPAGVDPLLTLRRDNEPEERPVTGRRLTLPEGTYTVTGRAEGYQEYSATVRVIDGETKSANITLARAQVISGRSISLLSTLAQNGWQLEGKVLTRTGGEFVLVQQDPAPGIYQFTILLQSGRRLEWFARFKDERNHVLFQLERNNFNRIEVVNGQRSRPVRVKHDMEQRNEFLSIRMQVTADAVVHHVFRNQKWEPLDSWQAPGGNFWQGRVGFHVPDRDKIGLSSFTFTPQ